MNDQNNSRIQPVLIVGGKNSGKTAYLEWTALKAQQTSKRVGGFISAAEFEHASKARYFLHNLETGQRRLLAWRSTQAHQLRVGSYAFDPKTFQWGTDFVQRQMDYDVLIIDEFGPLEMQGLGWYALLKELLTRFKGIVFISVRPSLLHDLLHLIKEARSD